MTEEEAPTALKWMMAAWDQGLTAWSKDDPAPASADEQSRLLRLIDALPCQVVEETLDRFAKSGNLDFHCEASWGMSCAVSFATPVHCPVGAPKCLFTIVLSTHVSRHPCKDELS
ncbi:hypothetical protein [Loktanella sp. Alg231-35]|uniref:hypothetical protein n=1 Tax=Loktanella sp. Alg231-35 TaxID=1922220 RepID=UPI00131EDC31|nr:hypothetical protein [Loktanella sp. Alg231-35]